MKSSLIPFVVALVVTLLCGGFCLHIIMSWLQGWFPQVSYSSSMRYGSGFSAAQGGLVVLLGALAYFYGYELWSHIRGYMRRRRKQRDR